MHKNMYDCAESHPDYHTNAFVNIDRYPYLVADYLDRRSFRQIDRSMVKDTIEVDQSEAMRVVVDVNVDDIGKRASDGMLATMGNNSKQVALAEMINRNYMRLQNRLPVLRKGIVLRINYRLENYSTGQTIKTMTEDFKIPEANYFLEINPKNVNDNAIVVNFTGSNISTMNYFTHGRDKMVMKITSVNMFYEVMKDGPCRPVGKEMYVGEPDCLLPSEYCDEFNMFSYQRNLENHGTVQHNCHSYGNENIIPPDWIMFNQYYHFSNNGKDVIIHQDEVYNRNAKVALVPCGSVVINRAFVINPCCRIIFKFSIWKNDTTVVHDTTMIARALRASVMSDPYHCGPSHIHTDHTGFCYDDRCDCYHPNDHFINPDHETLMNMYQRGEAMDYEQNAVINQLNTLVVELTKAINDIKGEGSGGEDTYKPSEVPVLPEAPKQEPCIPSHGHHHHDPVHELFHIVRDLQKQLEELKGDKTDPDDPKPPSGDCGCADKFKPMPDDIIKDAVDDALDETDPDKNSGH